MNRQLEGVPRPAREVSRDCPAKCPAQDVQEAQLFCGFGEGVPATVPAAVPNILKVSRNCPGGCPGKNGLGYGFGCSWCPAPVSAPRRGAGQRDSTGKRGHLFG